MILYRSVGLQELELIYDRGMRAFPARLAQQPIFYPVLDLEYARQVASDWNIKNGQFAGYVTQFKVEDQYISQFEEHTVGESQHQEFWIPAEEMEEFNQHIVGPIKIVEAHFGDAFQGFIPETFGMKGKKAVEQFTLLANSYLYKRMDFYLEIRRNHKAIFLNYPFWQIHEFKNQGLKGKILQAIKEAWFTSFPKIPLPMPIPIQEETPHPTPIDSDPLVNPVDEDTPLRKPIDSDSLVEPVHQDAPFVKRTDSRPLVNPTHEDTPPRKPTDSDSLVEPVHRETPFVKQTDSHFTQGIKLGLSAKYQEAIDELSKAVEENPNHVVAHTSLGVAFHGLGEDDRALSCYETALRIDPLDAEAHYFRSNILYSQGNVSEAIAGYRIAIGLRPELIEAHQKSAPQDRLTNYTGSPATMYWIAKPARRILDLTKSLETNPGQASLFKERAVEYYRLRNYVQAIADYSSSLKIHPDDASVLHLRGVVYEKIGQFDRAAEDFQRSIAINPQLSDEYINRGVALGNMGNYRQSIANLTESIRLAPKNPNGYFNRGTVFLQQGDFERAIDDFSNVIRLSPGDEEAYYWRGVSNEETGRQGDAIADYKQFLVLSQDANARAEVEQKLRQWNKDQPESASSRSVVPDDRQKINQVASEQTNQNLDLYDLVFALGERALHSTWFGSGVACYGEKAEELYAFADQNKPIDGHDLLRIASSIQQTIEGDFTAFDTGIPSPWIFIRAWGGNGFYIETNDPKIKNQLKTRFQAVEDVEGADPPYEGLFIRV